MEGLASGRILSREEKLRPDYGVKMARTMIALDSNNGFMSGLTSSQYLANIDISQGRDASFNTSAERYLGARDNPLLQKYGYGAVNPQLVNLMPKFVNLIHGKLMSMDYDIGVDVIDSTSMDEKKQVKDMLSSWLKIKDSVAQYGVTFDNIKEEAGVPELPSTTEDLEIMMTTIYKHYEAMKAELELMKVHSMNDWDAIKSKFIMELVVQGIAGVRTFVDGNGVIREEWFPINRFRGSYSESEDFDNLSHGGIIDYLTPEQFYSEAKDSLPHEKILETIKQFASNTNKDANIGGAGNYAFFGVPYGMERYIKVFRFQKIEEDVENWVQLTDRLGNKYMSKRKANFVIAPEEKPKYESGEKELFNVSTTTKYGGVWVIGSEVVYDYGIIQEGNDVKLDFHLYAPNMRYGKTSSVCSQIKEPVYMFSIAWSRLKHIVGQGWNGTVDINVDMMYNMSLGKGGKNLDPSDVLDLFFMEGVSLSKGKQSPADPNNGRAINIINEGLTATDFVSIMNLCIDTIRNICGINELSDASTPASGTLVGVADIANQNSNHAIAHYYRAYHSIYKRTSLAILGYWKNIPSNMAWTREYIVGLKASTTAQEWAIYNQELSRLVMIPLIDGGIRVDDKFELQYPNIKDLKQGEFLCKIRVKKNMKEAQARAEQAQNAQYEGNVRNIQETLAADKQRADMDFGYKVQYEQLLTAELAKRQQAITEGALQVKQLEMQGRIQVADTQGRDSVIKEAQRSASDQKIAEMKAQMDSMKLEYERMQHELEMTLKAVEIDNNKEEAKEKKKEAA